MTLSTPATVRVVPLKRHVKLGTVGPDARAVKRALARLSFYPRGGKALTPIFGIFAVRALKKAQRHYGLPVDGEYGSKTHHAFLRHVAFDAWGAYLMGAVKLPDPVQTKMDRVVHAALYCVAHRQFISYSQGQGRMQGVKQRLHLPNYPHIEDCSSFVTWLYFQAGLPDPNGFGYTGLGYTGTLAAHGYVVGTPKPGDLVLYGSGWPFVHVTCYLGAGRVVSHGGESGPLVCALDYRRDRAQIRRYV